MKRYLIAVFCLALGPFSRAQIISTNISVADAFVRSIDPTNNYGGAGALAVSGLIATNAIGQQEGLLDSFMRFDVSSAISNFDGAYGPGRWVIADATLILFEQGMPNNPIFNRGVGPFEVQWIATNSWLEGTGNPNLPTTDGIVWNDEPHVLNSNVDELLGTFVNGGTDGVVNATLALASRFIGEISTGGLVSLYFTAPTNSQVGFSFHSHNFVDPTQWPFLQLTALPMPQITSLVISGTDARIGVLTGIGITNIVEYSSTLASNSWTVLTNLIGTGGSAVAIDSGVATQPKRFYRVHLTTSP